MESDCKQVLKLPGGTFRVVNKKNATCFYCGGLISGVAIAEKVGGYPTRHYHIKCFTQVFGHRILVHETPSGICLS